MTVASWWALAASGFAAGAPAAARRCRSALGLRLLLALLVAVVVAVVAALVCCWLLWWVVGGGAGGGSGDRLRTGEVYRLVAAVEGKARTASSGRCTPCDLPRAGLTG